MGGKEERFFFYMAQKLVLCSCLFKLDYNEKSIFFLGQGTFNATFTFNTQ